MYLQKINVLGKQITAGQLTNMGATQYYHDNMFTIIFNMGITSKYIDRHSTASMTKNPPRDRYPASLPKVLSCKQQIIAISMVHKCKQWLLTYSNKHRCFIPSGKITSQSLIVYVNSSSDKRGMNPLSSINTPSTDTSNYFGQSIHKHRRACKIINKTYHR